MPSFIDLTSSDDEANRRADTSRRYAPLRPSKSQGASEDNPMFIEDDPPPPQPPHAFHPLPPRPPGNDQIQRLSGTGDQRSRIIKLASPPATLRSPSKRKQQPIQNPAAALRRQSSLTERTVEATGASKHQPTNEVPVISSGGLTDSIPNREAGEKKLPVTRHAGLPDFIPNHEASNSEIDAGENQPAGEASVLPQSEVKHISIFADLMSDEGESDQEKSDTEVVLKPGFFEAMLRDLSRQIDEFQEYVVRPLLQQTRLDSQSRSWSTVPQPTKSPFANLRPQHSVTTVEESLPCLHFQTKSYTSSAPGSKQQWSKVSIPVTRENDVIPCLPRYKSISRPGNSFLAPNIKIAKNIPYTREDEHSSEADRQKKYDEVQRRYHNYEENSANLHGQRACAEKVDLWRPWMGSFLTRLGLNTSDIAYYYCMNDSENICWNESVHLTDEELAFWTQEQSTACLSCEFQYELEKQKLWETVKSHAAEPRSIAVAGFACSAFHRVMQFSIFCALVGSTEFQATLRDTDRKRNGSMSSQKMCLVCGLHQCSLHGAYIEDPNLPERSDKESVKINDPEFLRNTRQLITLPSRVPEEYQKQRGRKKLTLTHKKSKPEVLNTTNRDFFTPCSHDGSCFNNPACTCFKQNISCEYFCGCDTSCRRRFRGCKCHAGGESVCANDYSCPCWAGSRECDPWLCHNCGVLEVLDQANKYDEEIRKGRCSNNKLQLGIPARTIKAPSEVQGYGLFAGQALKRGDFIGEYKGEILSEPEADRRGALYHLLGAEYLFILNSTQQIDATKFGSKTRFMNNSKKKANINVAGCVMLCNGVQRVMLSADRDIKAGEELLYDYGYPENISKTFWERGDRPSNQRANISEPVAKMATNAKKQQQEPLLQDPGSDESSEDEVQAGPSRSKVYARKTAKAFGGVSKPVTSDSDFSHHSEIDDSDIEEDAMTSSDDGKRTKRPGAKDGRFGGSAQRKAAQTRAKRAAAGQKY